MSDVRDRIERLWRRSTAYKQVFAHPRAPEVLAHMARFCRYRQTTYLGDPGEALIHEGQRRVFLMVVEQLDLEYGELERMLEEDDHGECS